MFVCLIVSRKTLRFTGATDGNLPVRGSVFYTSLQVPCKYIDFVKLSSVLQQNLEFSSITTLFLSENKENNQSVNN